MNINVKFISLIIHSFVYSIELEAAQKAASDTQTTPTNPAQSSSGDEEASGAPDLVEKPAPTPDYAAGLIPNNPPPTPLAAPPTPQPPPPPSIPSLTPIKANAVPSVRPPAPALGVIAPPASPGGPQVVRLVAPGPAASLTAPTVYRLVQPANTATGLPAPVSTITTSTQPAAPPKKSVALMLTVS